MSEASAPAGEEPDPQSFIEQNLRRNYAVHFVHGALGHTGFRLLYAPTLLPAYMQVITGSSALVGLAQTLLQLGGTLSPVIGASHIEQRRRLLPYAAKTGSLMRLQILGLALAGWLLGGAWLVAATMILLFLLGFYTGTQRVAFQILMAKVIPMARRGRLQAWRNLAGGTLAAGLSLGAGIYLVAPNMFGNGYATTFFLAFLLTSLGLLVLRLGIREPEAPGRKARGFKERLAAVPMLLSHRGYRAFLTSQALIAAGRMSAPFYILYASRTQGLDGELIGILSFAYLASDTISNLLWGYVGDQRGFRGPLTTSALLSAAALAVLLLAPPSWNILAFCGFGAAASAYTMSAATIVLEIGEPEDVPLRLAVSTSLEGALAATGPLIGGLIVWLAGFEWLFTASAFLFALASLAAMRIPARGSAGL